MWEHQSETFREKFLDMGYQSETTSFLLISDQQLEKLIMSTQQQFSLHAAILLTPLDKMCFIVLFLLKIEDAVHVLYSHPLLD